MSQMGEDPLENMRLRAAQCRRLADLTHDRSMAEQLRTWAGDIEGDIRRLTEERAQRDERPVEGGNSPTSTS